MNIVDLLIIFNVWWYRCRRCKGTGEIACYPDEAECPDCDGRGSKA